MKAFIKWTIINSIRLYISSTVQHQAYSQLHFITTKPAVKSYRNVPNQHQKRVIKEEQKQLGTSSPRVLIYGEKGSAMSGKRKVLWVWQSNSSKSDLTVQCVYVYGMCECTLKGLGGKLVWGKGRTGHFQKKSPYTPSYSTVNIVLSIETQKSYWCHPNCPQRLKGSAATQVLKQLFPFYWQSRGTLLKKIF